MRKLRAALGVQLVDLMDKRSKATDPAVRSRIDNEIVIVAGTMDEILEKLEPVEHIKIDGRWRAVPRHAAPATSVNYIEVDGKWRATTLPVKYIKVDGKWRAVPATTSEDY